MPIGMVDLFWKGSYEEFLIAYQFSQIPNIYQP